MQRATRRQFLGAASGSVAIAMAGCTGAFDSNLGTDEPEEFVVASTDLVHAPGYRWEEATYPEDIVARVVVENQQPQQAEAVLEATLYHEPANGEAEQWEERKDIGGGGGVSPTVILIFEDVYEDGNQFEDYDLETTLVEE